MLEKIKDPGSAITHFIGMLMAMFAATPLIIKSLHEPDYIHVISLTCFYCEYDPTLCGKHDLPYFKSFRKNKSYSPQVRPQYDLCTDCRKLHTNLPDRFERSGRIFPVRSCLAIALIGIIVKSAGSPVRNGFLLCFISAWAGSAYWLSHRLSIRSLRQLLDGSWQAVSFTLSAASFML